MELTGLEEFSHTKLVFDPVGSELDLAGVRYLLYPNIKIPNTYPSVDADKYKKIADFSDIQDSKQNAATRDGGALRPWQLATRFVGRNPPTFVGRSRLRTAKAEAHPPSPRLRRVPTSHSSTGLHPWLSAKEGKRQRKNGEMGQRE